MDQQEASTIPLTPRPEDPESVVFRGDGEPRTASDQIRRLNEIASGPGFEEDDFSVGGSVARLEEAIADRLGKERAIFMPTGTLANHLALRRHCGTGGRAAVQEQSHLFNDTGDSVQRLSGINLVPLAPGRTGFTASDLEEAFRTSVTGRVLNPISAVMVETPVRRRSGKVVPWEDLVSITDLCRSIGIPSHLDGARIFMMAAATGRDASDYAGLFDTVYVSLYKYLGAPFGGILAGAGEFIEGMHHDRRMFGGGLAQAGLVAALALRGLAGFEEVFAAAMSRANDLFFDIGRLPGLSITPFKHGSNIFPLHIEGPTSPVRLAESLARRGVFIYPDDGSDTVDLHVNSTVLRRPREALAGAFAEALSEQREEGRA